MHCAEIQSRQENSLESSSHEAGLCHCTGFVERDERCISHPVATSKFFDRGIWRKTLQQRLPAKVTSRDQRLTLRCGSDSFFSLSRIHVFVRRLLPMSPTLPLLLPRFLFSLPRYVRADNRTRLSGSTARYHYSGSIEATELGQGKHVDGVIPKALARLLPLAPSPCRLLPPAIRERPFCTAPFIHSRYFAFFLGETARAASTGRYERLFWLIDRWPALVQQEAFSAFQGEDADADAGSEGVLHLACRATAHRCVQLCLEREVSTNVVSVVRGCARLDGNQR